MEFSFDILHSTYWQMIDVTKIAANLNNLILNLQFDRGQSAIGASDSSDRSKDKLDQKVKYYMHKICENS